MYWWIYLLILVVIVVLLIVSQFVIKETVQTESRILRSFYKLAFFLYCVVGRGKEKNFLGTSKSQQHIERELELINPSVSGAKQYMDLRIKRIATLILYTIGGLCLCLIVSAQAGMSKYLSENGVILRSGYNGNGFTVSLSAEYEDKKETLDIQVENQRYSTEQIEELFEQAKSEIDTIIIGNNSSLDKVINNLNLVTQIENFPFSITWESSNYRLIDNTGQIYNEGLEKEEIVELTAEFEYFEMKYLYTVVVQIYPAPLTDEVVFRKEIENTLLEEEIRSRTNESFVLPNIIGGKEILWEEEVIDASAGLFLLLIILIMIGYCSQKNEILSMAQKRQKELRFSYAGLVSKVTLYLNAGMTLRNVFFRIAEEYQNRRMEGDGKEYIQEEILLTCRELQIGISETEAYEHLGKRCKSREYIRLCTLLSQNLKKGSNNLIALLQQEVKDAFEERKNIAKKLGEEAGTKLLGPMMLLLCVVMVVIMIPAYLSFSI